VPDWVRLRLAAWGSDGLDKLAVFEHADYPAATVVEQVKGFAGASGFDGDSKGFFGASLAGIVVAVDGGGVLDGGQVKHGFRAGVEALASDAHILHHVPPWSTLGSHIPQQCLSVADRPRHTCNATSRLDRIQPLLLLWSEPAGCGLHLNAGEHRHGAADHLWRHRHALPADQVGAALAQTELNRAAILIPERAGVIAEQARVAIAAGDPYFLLDPLLAHLDAMPLGQPSLINPLSPTALIAALLR
jgi:hypothetical protein